MKRDNNIDESIVKIIEKKRFCPKMHLIQTEMECKDLNVGEKKAAREEFIKVEDKEYFKKKYEAMKEN